ARWKSGLVGRRVWPPADAPLVLHSRQVRMLDDATPFVNFGEYHEDWRNVRNAADMRHRNLVLYGTHKVDYGCKWRRGGCGIWNASGGSLVAETGRSARRAGRARMRAGNGWGLGLRAGMAGLPALWRTVA